MRATCFIGLLLALLFAVVPVSQAQLTKEQVDDLNRRIAEQQAKDRRETIAKLIASVEKATEKDLSPNNAIDFLHHQSQLTADEGVPVYQRFLTHPHPWVRQSCMRALADHRAKARSAGPAVFEIYRNDPHNYNRDEALLTMGKIGYEHKELWELLIARLEHVDPYIRHYHANHIGLAASHYGPAAKILLPALHKVLAETNLDLMARLNVYRGIGGVMALPSPSTNDIRTITIIDWKHGDGGYALIQALKKPEHQGRAASIAIATLRKPVPNYGLYELYSLLGIVAGTSPDAVRELLVGVEHSDPRIKTVARDAFNMIPPNSNTVLEFLVSTLKDTESRDLPVMVAYLLSKWGRRAKPATEGVVKRLRQIEDDATPETILPYLLLLRKIGPDAAAASRQLTLMVKRDNFAKTDKFYPTRMRGMLIATLTDIGGAADVEEEIIALLKPINGKQYDRVNYMWAARALASFKTTNNDVVPLLSVALTNDHRWTKPVDTLTGEEHFFVPPLTSSSPRMEAIKALGRLGPSAKEAVPLLETIANEKKLNLPAGLQGRWSNDAAAEAHAALKKIQP